MIFSYISTGESSVSCSSITWRMRVSEETRKPLPHLLQVKFLPIGKIRNEGQQAILSINYIDITNQNNIPLLGDKFGAARNSGKRKGDWHKKVFAILGERIVSYEGSD